MGSQALGSDLGAIWANSSDLGPVPESGLLAQPLPGFAEHYVSNRSDLTSARIQLPAESTHRAARLTGNRAKLAVGSTVRVRPTVPSDWRFVRTFAPAAG
jgi:hypothetical protein